MARSRKFLKNKFSVLSSKIFILFLFIHCNQSTNDFLEKTKLLGIGNEKDFAQPEIRSVYPINDQRDVTTDTTLAINFSQPMDKVATETGFTLSSNGGNADVRLTWIFDQRLEITVKGGMSAGKKYELRLNRDLLKDAKGNHPAKNFLSNFYTVGTGQYPSIVSSSPSPDSGIVYNYPVRQNLAITFSEPMDRAVANNAISITGGPAVYIKNWNAASTKVTLELQSDLVLSTSYILKVSTGAKNVIGVGLEQEYNVIFFTGNNATLPDIFSVSATPNSAPWPTMLPAPALNSVTGVSKNDYIQFIFTKAMDKISAQSAISLTPSVSGNFVWISGSILQFQPTQKFDQLGQYRLTIADSAKDLSGLPLAKSYIIDFKVDNTFDSTPITVSAIRGYNVNASCTSSIDTLISPPLALPLDQNIVYALNLSSTSCATNDYIFEIDFNTAGGCALKTSGDGDIYEQVSVNYFSGSPMSSPNVFYKFYNPPTSCTGAGTYKIGIKSVTPLAVQYKFILRGGSSGLKDINGNYLLQDLYFLFNF